MKQFDFIVFGATGQQGSICCKDLLLSGFSVLMCGRDPSKIVPLLKYPKAEFYKVDLQIADEIVQAIIFSGAKIVVNCAELKFNIAIMQACLATTTSCTDLGGLQEMTEKQYALDEKYKKAGITNITGCGSTPGIANVMTAYAIQKMDTVETISLGFARDSNIKKFVVPYSMESIFEEFQEIPTVLRNGKFTKIDRLENKQTHDFMKVGIQDVYPIVHSEVYTFKKYFTDKGLKNVTYLAGFPAHSLNAITTLIELGFSSHTPMEVGYVHVVPVDFTSMLLRKLPYPEGYTEVENIRIKIEGTQKGIPLRKEMNCVVKTTKGWEDAGSNVNTGRTISIISQMLKNGLIKMTGVTAPEVCIDHKKFFDELGQRDMTIFEDGKMICGPECVIKKPS